MIKVLVGILLVIGFLSLLGGIALTFVGGTVNGQGSGNIFIGVFIMGIAAIIWHYKKPKSTPKIES